MSGLDRSEAGREASWAKARKVLLAALCCAVPAPRKRWVTILGHPSNACLRPMDGFTAAPNMTSRDQPRAPYSSSRSLTDTVAVSKQDHFSAQKGYGRRAPPLGRIRPSFPKPERFSTKTNTICSAKPSPISCPPGRQHSLIVRKMVSATARTTCTGSTSV
jgi:hypothetical protein